MKPFSKKTNEEIYLDWLNDWLSIERMADNYGISAKELEKIIDKGRDEHLNKFESGAYKKIWLPLKDSSNKVIDILEITK
jgi:hypothetical protein